MAYLKLTLKPGIDNQNTEYGAEGGWIDCDNVRFRYGLPEKIGGWSELAPFNNNINYLIGNVSEIHTWNDLAGAPYAAFGTDRKLYINKGNVYYDITPLRSENNNIGFSTTSGSANVTVNDNTHGAIAGDFVTFTNVTNNPGNIPNADLQAEFEIQSITNVNSYVILSSTTATATNTTGSGVATYQINIGSDVAFSDFGFGVGTWGADEWGTGRSGTGTGITLDQRVWQFDNFGEDLICQLVNGGIYQWDTSNGVTNRATAITGAPTKSSFALVSTPDRHLVTFGTEATIGSSGTQDPMFVRFSNQEDINTFVESATNTAGGQRLTDGNKIVTALRSRGQILILTDTSLHGMQFIGPPFTFGFQQLGANCGCVGPHAAADVNGLAFWMSQEAFYVFDGTVKKLPCTVQDSVFQDINLFQQAKFTVGINSEFNELTWWYCSANSEQNNRSVTYNYLENVWSIGSTMARTAWRDVGSFNNPIATEYDADSTGTYYISTINGLTDGRSIVYEHELGVDANGSAMNCFLQSGYFDIGDGDQMMLMSRFVPDFKDQQKDLTVNLFLRRYPESTATNSSLDPYTVSPTTEKIDTRARGRQISLKITANVLGSKWRYGTMRVDIQPDGRR
jgi:hypothetical protein